MTKRRDLSDAEEKDVYQAGLDLLVRREHSSTELLQKLLLRQCEHTLAKQVVQQLEAEGSLSNQRFAESYALSRIEKGDGPLKILASLYQRGIDENLAANVLQGHAIDWFDNARIAFEKKLATLSSNDPKRIQRLDRFMRSRGYEYKFYKRLIENL